MDRGTDAKERMKKAYLVFTTINVPKIAEQFCSNFEKFGHENDVGIIIIGDRKSPDKASFDICNRLQNQGFDIEYFDIEKQERWLKDYPEFKKIIPYNSDNRRNIGFLIALERGCEFIISVDDDNYPQRDIDFFKYHSIVGTKQIIPTIRTNSNWFNVCDLLEKSPNQRIYPRGYPYNKRWEDTSITKEKKEVNVMLNQGLWLGDPDVDSITRINRDVKITGFIDEQIALEIGVWSPINTQNTSIHVDILPAFYFVLMNERVDGMIIDRYGDIWAGLFTKKIMDSLNYHASFGNPIVNHVRNKHSLFEDLKQELGCIIYTDLLVDILEGIELEGKNALELYANLSDQLLQHVSTDKRFSGDFRSYLRKLNHAQMVWLETIEDIKSCSHF